MFGPRGLLLSIRGENIMRKRENATRDGFLFSLRREWHRSRYLKIYFKLIFVNCKSDYNIYAHEALMSITFSALVYYICI